MSTPSLRAGTAGLCCGVHTPPTSVTLQTRSRDRCRWDESVSPSYEREWEKTWDRYSKHGRSCRLSPIDTNERDFLHTLVRKRPLGLSRFETMPHNAYDDPRPFGVRRVNCDVRQRTTRRSCKMIRTSDPSCTNRADRVCPERGRDGTSPESDRSGAAQSISLL